MNNIRKAKVLYIMCMCTLADCCHIQTYHYVNYQHSGLMKTVLLSNIGYISTSSIYTCANGCLHTASPVLFSSVNIPGTTLQGEREMERARERDERERGRKRGRERETTTFSY